VNSGRLSVPSTYNGSALNTDDALPGAPTSTRPGAPCVDAPLGQGYLLENLGSNLTILTLNADAPDKITEAGNTAISLALPLNDALKNRYLGSATSAVYLIRPDQYVAGRWDSFDESAICTAIRRMTGKV